MGTYTTFEEVFRLLKEYKDEHGHCKVSREHKVGTIHLGHIVDDIRHGKRKITTEQKAMLNSIGFVWKVQESPTYFDEVFRLLEDYKAEHRHCDIPKDYEVSSINLGQIVQNIRSGRRKTTTEQKAMLDSIGFVWQVQQRGTSFEEVVTMLKEYKEEHGHCNIPKECKIGDINLGWIVRDIRSGDRKTTADQKAMLNSIGFVWRVHNRPTSFEEVVTMLKEYKEEHGHCNIPKGHKVGTINLGTLVQDIRGGKRKITPEQKTMLDSIGFAWKVQNRKK